MQVKINGRTINCEVLPLVSETLDESLDIFSFALNISKVATPFAAMQKVEVTTDNNEKLLFVISSDSVSLASLDPVVYRHEIHCTQNTEELKKKLVRNSVFSQPPIPWETFNQPHSYCLGFSTENTSLPDSINRYHANLVMSGFSLSSGAGIESVTISSKKKFVKCLFKMDLRIAIKMQSGSVGDGINQWWYPQDSDEIISRFGEMTYSTLTIRDNITVHYYDAEGNPHSDIKTPLQLFGVNKWLFNQEVEVDYFNELLKNGCYDIYIGDIIDGQQLITGDIYAVTETESPIFYTINYKFKVESYYYTCYDVLDLLIKRQQQAYNGESREQLFKLRNSGELYDLLTNTIAPNYTFTQNTMYECVAEIFRLFDAIFTMDEEGYLGIEYFNDRNKEELPINTKIAGANLSLGENRFVNKLVSFYQNAKQEITHPNPQGFCKPRNEELGVPSNVGSFTYLVGYDIDEMIEVNLLVTGVRINCGWGSSAIQGFATGVTVTGNFLIDMTRYCVNQELWSTLGQIIDENDIKTNPQHRFQGNTISFSGKRINLCTTFNMSNGVEFYSLNLAILCAYWHQLGLTEAGAYGEINDISIYRLTNPHTEYNTSRQPDFADINMQVKYIATLDGRTISESNTYKYDGEEMIDQYNGAVDLEKMGCNMLGINYKSGEPQLSVNQVIKTWSKRIKKGQILNYADEKWVANVCSYTILENGLISGQISFVKNFNALSLNTRLIREKRMSAISNELTMKSEDNIVEYAYYDINPVGLVDDTLAISGSKIVNGVLGSFDFSKVDKTLFNSLDIGVVTRDGVNVHPRRWVYAPLNKYSNGNGICYEISYNSPLVAGNRTRYVTATDTWFGQNKWFTDYVKYADDDGFLEKISIGVFRKAGNNSTTYSVNDEYFPMVDDNFTLKAVEINEYYCYKQPNEIFALNYQLSFIPVNETDVFFYPRFFKESLFLGESYCNRKVYLVATHEKFSIFDMKVDSLLDMKEVTSITSNNYNKLTLTTSVWFDYYKDGGVAIVDSNRNILFAYNTEENGSNDHVDIYFGYKRVREKISQDRYVLYLVFNNSQVDSVDLRINGVTTTYYDSTSIPVEIGDTYSWVAYNKIGYHIASGSSGSGTIANKTTVIEVVSRKSVYTLIGISENGTVAFYNYAGSTTPISTAKYGETKFYQITANTGFNPPETSSNYVTINESNFVLNDDNETATITLSPCTIKVFSFYVYSYNGTVSGSYYNPYSDETIAIEIENGGSQLIEIEYGGNYSFDYNPLPNRESDTTHYEGNNITSSVNNIYCNSTLVTYSFSVSATNGSVSGWYEDYQGNRTSVSITGGGGQTITVEKAGAYYFEFTPQQNYYATTPTIYSANNVQSQPSGINFSATMKPRLTIAAYNGTASGTIYDEDGNVTDTINVTNQSGITYYVEPGGRYDVVYSWDTNIYYYNGTSEYHETNVTTDHSYTFTATAYPTYAIDVSSYGGTTIGTRYNRDGTVAETKTWTNQSGTMFNVVQGARYTLSYAITDSTNTYFDGQTSYDISNVQAAASYSFVASAYKYINITIPTGVSYVSLSGDFSGNYSSNATIKTKQGLSVSWTTQAETGYIVTSGGTGTNVSTNNDITISPQVLNVGIPSAWNIWSPSVHQQSGVAESTWKSTMAIKNAAFTNTTFYVNNNAVTVPQNASGFTGFTFANLGCQYIDADLSTTAPSTTEINGNIYLVDKAYSTVYPSVASNYSYRVYFVRVNLHPYNSSSLPSGSSIRVNIQFGLHQGYYLVDNGTALTFAKANYNIDAGSLTTVVDSNNNSVQIVFNTKSSFPNTDGTYLYLTVIVKNW